MAMESKDELLLIGESFSPWTKKKRLDRKYAHLPRAGSLRTAMDATREGLANSGTDYLGGEFSYADITMAVVLDVISPIANTDPPLGVVTQHCWKDPALAVEFKDLLAWRDRLVAASSTTFSQFR